MLMKLMERADIPDGERQQLQAELEGLTTLERLLDWGRSHEPPIELGQVVTQDEFTHDVLLRHDRGLYLVFDVT